MKYLNISLPYPLINLTLNSIPVYIGFRFIGKKFTLFSLLTIVLTSTLTDILPYHPLTYDTLLISIFGGIINGAAISMVLSVDADYEGEKTFELVKQIRKIADKYYPDSFYLAGEGVSTYDLMDTITADMIKVNLLAIGAVFLVLLITLKSVTVPIILVLSIETAIWLNLSVPYF